EAGGQRRTARRHLRRDGEPRPAIDRSRGRGRVVLIPHHPTPTTQELRRHRGQREQKPSLVFLRVLRALRAFVVNSRIAYAQRGGSPTQQRSLAIHHEDTKDTKGTKNSLEKNNR